MKNKKLRLALLSLAAIIAFTGVAATPSENPSKVEAFSIGTLKTQVGETPVKYPSHFTVADVDRIFLFPHLLVSDSSNYFPSVNGKKSLSLSANYIKGDAKVWSQMMAEVTISQRTQGPVIVYSGPISRLTNVDLLQTNNPVLKKDINRAIRVEVWLPKGSRGGVQTRTVFWNFVLSAR